MSEFKISGSITEDDIPPQGAHREMKYDPVARSAKTLEVGEGIEVEVENANQVQHIRRTIDKRLPRRHFLVTGRSRPDGHKVYIIRKS